jgi:hypothetical protein
MEARMDASFLQKGYLWIKPQIHLLYQFYDVDENFRSFGLTHQPWIEKAVENRSVFTKTGEPVRTGFIGF